MAAKKVGGASLGGANQTVVLVVVWVIAVIGVLAGYYFLLYDPLAQDRVQQEARRTELPASRLRSRRQLRCSAPTRSEGCRPCTKCRWSTHGGACSSASRSAASSSCRTTSSSS